MVSSDSEQKAETLTKPKDVSETCGVSIEWSPMDSVHSRTVPGFSVRPAPQNAMSNQSVARGIDEQWAFERNDGPLSDHMELTGNAISQ
jgi:hypothetical protein